MLTDNQVIAIFLGSVATLFSSLYLVYLWGTKRIEKQKAEKNASK